MQAGRQSGGQAAWLATRQETSLATKDSQYKLLTNKQVLIFISIFFFFSLLPWFLLMPSCIFSFGILAQQIQLAEVLFAVMLHFLLLLLLLLVACCIGQNKRQSALKQFKKDLLPEICAAHCLRNIYLHRLCKYQTENQTGQKSNLNAKEHHK